MTGKNTFLFTIGWIEAELLSTLYVSTHEHTHKNAVKINKINIYLCKLRLGQKHGGGVGMKQSGALSSTAKTSPPEGREPMKYVCKHISMLIM